MRVTLLTPQGRTKTRVEIDYDETLVLSNKDCRLYGLQEGEEIPEETWTELMGQLRSGALRKCGSLLKDMDYSYQGLVDKLERNGFPHDVACEAADRMKEAHYIDDRRLAEGYLKYHIQDRSLQRIRQDLSKKGISREMIEETITSFWDSNGGKDPDSTAEKGTGTDLIQTQEKEQIRRLLQKRHFDLDTADYAEIQKTAAFLMRKGYSSENIRSVMREENRKEGPE